MEDTIKQLKGQRTSLKSKVTSLANLLISSIEQQDIDDIETLRSQLKTTYSNFLTIHFDYSEHVESDETFSSYLTVNGMDLIAYQNDVKTSFDRAIQCYSKWQLSLSKSKMAISQAIKKANILVSVCINQAAINGHKDFCVELSNKLAGTVGLDSLLLSLYDVILDLESCKVSPPANSVGGQPPRNSVSKSDPPVTDASQAGGGLGQGSRAVGSQSDHDSGVVQQVSASDGHVESSVQTQQTPPVPLEQSTPAAAPAVHMVSGSNGSRDTHKSRLAVHDLHLDTQRVNEFMQISKSSVVNAYDGYDASRHLNVTSAGNSNQISCTRSKPTPYNGDRHKWPEFLSVWYRYSCMFVDEVDKASELKKFLVGEPLELVSPIFATQPNAHDRMVQRLKEVYGDVSLGIKSVFSHLNSLRSIHEGDTKALVKFVNTVESSFSQLGELGHLTSVTLPHVDNLADLLPPTIRRDWDHCYDMFPQKDKVQPFKMFMGFLESERRRALRRTGTHRSDQQKDNSKQKVKTFHVESDNEVSQNSHDKPDSSAMSCVIHGSNRHALADCRSFRSLSVQERFDLCKTHAICVRCLNKHDPKSCPRFRQCCSKCKKPNHHDLLCRKGIADKNKSSKPEAKTESKPSSVRSQSKEKVSTLHGAGTPTDEVSVEVSTNHGTSRPTSDSTVFAIQRASVVGTSHRALLFFDGGSNSTLISHRAAIAWGAKRLKKVTLELSTLGGSTVEEESWLFEVKLMAYDNSVITIHALSIQRLTGSINKPLDRVILQQLFPSIDSQLLIKDSGPIDMLIGNDLLGFHPRKEIASAGQHLQVCSGPFGLCVQGSHPALGNSNSIPSSFFINILSMQDTEVITATHPQHKEFSVSVHSYLTKAEKASLGAFIQGEDLGVEVQPRCGACQCGKCPIRGHSYSFQEEQELQMIRSNLKYDQENKRWKTSYPWIVNPSTLPDNYSAALATLRNTERTLNKDPEWSKIYGAQIQDMVDRGVARKLSKEELKSWCGPKYYISHLAVQNPKSTSTPVRIVFNSSQTFRGTSLNACLAKGPESYLNDLLGILLRWREEKIALVADIKKMYNSIFINNVEQHTHRFLWRNLEQRDPDVYIILRVNMGDRPAAAISSEAIYKTADLFHKEYPRVAELLKSSTYVDDIVDSFPSHESAMVTAEGTNVVLQNAGFKVKCWLFSGEPDKRIQLEDLPPPDAKPVSTQVLGVHWNSSTDVITFSTNLNFSPKKKGVYTKPDLTETEFTRQMPEILTRRIVLEQTMKIYDPLGILCPFTMRAKQLLRETWTFKLDWDDQLPQLMREQWIKFFRELFKLSKLEYPRCLRPENAVGQPQLIILSDGSAAAYGFSAYARWKLNSGKFSCSLIMAKCRIAPLKQLTIPQIELNAAVLSKRGRKVLEKEMRYNFSRVYQLVDSETVLKMMNKKSTRFKLYEGVRIGELQTATDGDMSSWFWVKGEENTADWLTRGKSIDKIGPASEWWRGPNFLYQPEEEWGIRANKDSGELLPGEKKAVYATTVTTPDHFIQYENFSSLKRLIWTVARVRMAVKSGHFCNLLAPVSAEDLRAAQLILIRDVQHSIEDELQKKKGKYSQLHPVKTEDGVWIVGSRLIRHNPMTSIKTHTQWIIPSSHPYTALALRQAHTDSFHRGRDATLARFRALHWTTQGSKLARKVTSSCQLCKLKAPQILGQQMGQLPVERLKTAPPFNSVMIDLFGPYIVRGDVHKRSSGKAYGVLFTDIGSRAVHIEAVYGYDTDSFLLALTRFANIRGWPEKIFSDPGTQLVGAERELGDVWDAMDKTVLQNTSAEQGLQWIFGPGDAPWYQGAAESLIKAVKRCFIFSVGNKRLSPSEFQTVCTEAANTLNERPLGILPGTDSDISILTPNCQLIGRPFAKNPGQWSSDNSLKSRLALVAAVSEDFWKKWTELYAPTLMYQQKWHKPQQNLQVGDIVVVIDSNQLKNQYKIARVHEVYPSDDGRVRKVALAYKNFKVGSKLVEYHGCKDTIIMRSVHRLALLTTVSG